MIVQYPAFEAWLIADIAGFQHATEVVTGVDPTTAWTNVDEEVTNPGAWINRHVVPGVKFKPNGATRVARVIDVEVAARKSRSFDKFSRECRKAYAEWEITCVTP